MSCALLDAVSPYTNKADKQELLLPPLLNLHIESCYVEDKMIINQGHFVKTLNSFAFFGNYFTFGAGIIGTDLVF